MFACTLDETSHLSILRLLTIGAFALTERRSPRRPDQNHNTADKRSFVCFIAPMTAITLPPPEQFLRDDVIRGGMDLMFFAHTRHLAHADAQLAGLGLGRAHHRVLYFLARKPDITVGDLLAILGVTKQSLGRVVKDLTQKRLLIARPGDEDRRQRLLSLTAEGRALEGELFDDLKQNMARAYSASGGAAVAGYWTVTQNLMGEEARALFAKLVSFG